MCWSPGLTAFPVALIAPVTRLSAWGFAAQGTVWLVLLGCGLWQYPRAAGSPRTAPACC